MFADIQQHALMHLAFFLGVVALLLRDQLYLRTVLVISVAVSTVYHATTHNGPMWDDLFWNVVTMATNVVVLIQIVLDRTHVGLTAEEQRLFHAFGSLSPGEFRKLISLAEQTTAQRTTVLTREAVQPESLYFVLDGSVTLEKAGRLSRLQAPMFVGEVAFVKNRGASATVTVGEGARYVVWSSSRLKAYFAKHHALRVALIRALSADMADKIALAQPDDMRTAV